MGILNFFSGKKKETTPKLDVDIVSPIKPDKVEIVTNSNIEYLTIDLPYSSKYLKCENMWVFNYADDKNLRVVVEYKPIENVYYFYGEAKPKSNWVTFNVLKIVEIDDITFVEAIDFIEKDIPAKIEKLKIIMELYKHFKDDGIKITEIEE